MKIIYSLLSILFLTNCAGNTAENKTTSESKQPDENAGNSTSVSAYVKIFQDGKQVASYTASSPRALRLTEKSGKETLMIELNSSDNVYALMGTVHTVASGSYTLGEEGKADAQVQVLTDGTTKLPTMMNLSSGNLKITLSGQTCSGSFTGIENDVAGKKYEVSGSFLSIPVSKETASQAP